MERYDRVRAELVTGKAMRQGRLAVERQEGGSGGGREDEGDESLIQRSTTVTGSYTIRDSGQGSGTVRREGGIIYEEQPGEAEERARSGIGPTQAKSPPTTAWLTPLTPPPPLMVRNTTSLLSPVTPVGSTQSAGKAAGDAKGERCPAPNTRIGSGLCLPRGALAMLLVGVAFLVTVQFFFLIRFIHRKCDREEEEEGEECGGPNGRNSSLTDPTSSLSARSSASSSSLLNFMPSRDAGSLASSETSVPLPISVAHRYVMQSGRVTTFGVLKGGGGGMGGSGVERPVVDICDLPHMDHSPRSSVPTARYSLRSYRH